MSPEERSNEELRALCDAASPGPWGAADEHGEWPGAAPAWCVSRMDGEKWLYDVFYHASQSDGDQAQRDSEFVAAARTAVPSLLARIAAVEAKAERLRGYAEQYLYDGDGGQPLPGYVEVYGAADELSALAASPTPTGPEPTHYSVWRFRDDEEVEVCAVCSPKHTPEERWQLWPCPATPEPTKEQR